MGFTERALPLLQGKSVHCGWDPEGGEGSAAGQPKDQVFHGGSRSQKIK